MSKHQLVVLVVVGAALAACSKKKEAPASEKTVEGAAVASGSSAPLAPGAKIGPIDLTAPSFDLIALFPNVEVEVMPIELSGASVDDRAAYDTISIEQDGWVTMTVELEPKTDRVHAIIVRGASIATPGGLDVGKPISALAGAHADATCATHDAITTCRGASTGAFSYQLDARSDTGVAPGEVVPIAKIVPTIPIGRVTWTPPAGKGPTLSRRPPDFDPANDGDEELEDEGEHEEPRKPTAEEIDLCTRVRMLTQACGVSHDYEFGWVKSDKKKLAAAAAKKECSPAAHINDEDGMSTFPVPILELASVEKLEAAARKDCKAVTDALDEVSPGPGPAGYVP